MTASATAHDAARPHSVTRFVVLLAALVSVACGSGAPSPPERERLKVMIPASYREQIRTLMESGEVPFATRYGDIDWVDMPGYAGRDAVFPPSLAARFSDSDPDADVLFLDLYRLGSFQPAWLTRFESGPFEKLDQTFRSAFLDASRLGSDPSRGAADAPAPPPGAGSSPAYAIPWSAQANFLYYRTDLVQSTPQSWGELREACERVVDRGVPRGMRYCLLLTWESIENDLYPALWSLGASGARLESKGVVDFATELASWFGLELGGGLRMLPSPKQAPEVGRDIHKRFLGGEAVFMINWSNRYRFMADDAKAKGQVVPPVQMAPIPPALPGGVAYSNVGTWGWIVPAMRSKPTTTTEDRHARAVRFVADVTSAASASFLMRTTGLIPARTDVPLPEDVAAIMAAPVKAALGDGKSSDDKDSDGKGSGGPAMATFKFRDRGYDAFTHGFVRDAFRDLAMCRTSLSQKVPSSLIGDCARYYEDCIESETPGTDCLRHAISRRLKAAQRNVLVVSPTAEPSE
ncbi:MAG: extracellular solute-binding protein [Myxococcales bacterium]|nr:extracellular solute-binding protein [Myxococcales bacterium]